MSLNDHQSKLASPDIMGSADEVDIGTLVQASRKRKAEEMDGISDTDSSSADDDSSASSVSSASSISSASSASSASCAMVLVPSLPLSKKELFNKEAANFIINMTKDEVIKVIPGMDAKEWEIFHLGIKKWVKNGGKTSYNWGKACKAFGRMYSTAGLQNFKRLIRNTLAKGIYKDIDVANAQPSILLGLAGRKGWACPIVAVYNSTRDEKIKEIMDLLEFDRHDAKAECTSIFFGRGKEHVAKLPPFFVGLQEELAKLRALVWNDPEFKAIKDKVIKMEDKTYKEATLFAYVLQDEERKCLLAMEFALNDMGFAMDTYIHDGGLVRPIDGKKELDAEALRYCEQKIKEATGYDVVLAEKPLEPVLEIPEYVPAELVTDAMAARTFLKINEGNIVLDRNNLWAYDKSTGVWRLQDKSMPVLHKLVTNCGDLLNFQVSKGFKSYSGDHNKSCALLNKLPSVMDSSDGYFETRIDSDFGKLLFQDGMYDFKTSTFLAFDRDVIFSSSIPHKFSDVMAIDEALVDKVDQVLFRDSYKDHEIGATLRHYLMRGVYGDYKMKKWIIIVGPTNCGKGVFTRISEKALGTACAQPAANNLLKRKDGGEPSKELGWILECVNARLSITQEIRVSKANPIDGTLVKSFSSGGDKMTGRINYGHDTKVVNKSLLILMANEVGEIAPTDDALLERSIVVTPYYSFVNEPKQKHEKAKVPGFLGWEADPKTPLAFLKLMIREHDSWYATGYAEPSIPESMKQAKADVLSKPDVRGCLEDTYEITEDPADKTLYNELKDYLQQNLKELSETAIPRALGELGLESKNCTVQGKTQRYRTGIRRKVQEKQDFFASSTIKQDVGGQ